MASSSRAQFAQRVAQIVVRVGIARGQLQCGTVTGGGLFRLSQFAQGVTQVVMGGKLGGIGTQRCAELRRCVREFTQGEQRIAQLQQNLGMPGNQLQRGLVASAGLIGLAQFQQQPTQVVMQFGVAWVAAYGLTQLLYLLGMHGEILTDYRYIVPRSISRLLPKPGTFSTRNPAAVNPRRTAPAQV